MAKLFLIFLFVPLIEIYFLIQVGDVIGAGFTIFMVVLTALIGAALVRFQGLTTLARAQSEMLSNRMPALEVIEGALLLLAGALLLIPGFVSDALGFIILIPPLRQRLVQRFLKKRVMPVDGQVYDGESREADERIIDIEYKDLDK
jgi:UPF0716 protein FxsA